MAASTTLTAGQYQVSVILEGPAAKTPLAMLSDVFQMIDASDAVALASNASSILVLSPTAASEVVLGETVLVSWETRGVSGTQVVTVALVSSAAQATVKTVQVSSSSSVGSLPWTFDALVQLAIANVASGATAPVAVVDNTGVFAWVPPSTLGGGVFFLEISASVGGRTQYTTSNNLQAFSWMAPSDPGSYRVRVTVEGTIGTTPLSEVISAPPQPDPCLGKPPKAVATAEEIFSKTGPGAAITFESGRGVALLSGSESVACDGKAVSSYQWAEIELTDPRRPALIASASSAQTTVKRLRAGISTFQLTVTDRLGQSSTAVVKITVLNRKTVTCVICIDGAGASTFARTFNGTSVGSALASALGAAANVQFDANAFGNVRAATCPEGAGAAISAQVPAVFGKPRLGLLQSCSALGPYPVRRVFINVANPLGNPPPSVPVLSIRPSNKYSYIIIDRKTKLGKADVFAASRDFPPGVLSGFEWYVSDALQSSTADSLSLSLKAGTYFVRAIALDDENAYAESDMLTLYVTDEYTCNVPKDIVVAVDAAASAASYASAMEFVQMLLRPFWLQGPDSYASFVRFNLAPSGNASLVVDRAEVKTLHDLIAAKKLSTETFPSMPRLMSRGVEAGRAVLEARRRAGVVRSMVLLSFDAPLDTGETRNASALARKRSNVYAVPAISDRYAFASGFDLFREIVTQPNVTSMLPVTLELQEEVQNAAIALAITICEGRAPAGADDPNEVGQSIGRAITAAVAAAVAGGVAFSLRCRVNGQQRRRRRRQRLRQRGLRFLALSLPGNYNATSTSAQWTMFCLGSFGQRSSGGGKSGRRHLLGINSFSREIGGEIGAPFLQESLFWTAVIFVGVSVLQAVGTFVCRHHFKFEETPKILWFPKPQITVLIIAYEGFILACAATARLNDTYWRTTGALLLACAGGFFLIFTVAVIVWRLQFESQILWLEHEEPDWKRMWAGKDRGDGDDEMRMIELEQASAAGFLIFPAWNRTFAQDEFRQFRHKQEDLIAEGKGKVPATPAFVHPHGHRARGGAGPAHGEQERARGGADLAAMLVPGGARRRPPHAPKAAKADLELWSPEAPKPMDEYSRTKRWLQRQVREARERRARLALWWRGSLARRHLRIWVVWANWERGLWVVDPRQQEAKRTFWTARNFRWTFDAFFDPYRGDNFGKWFGTWDLLKKLSSGLAGPDGPAFWYVGLQIAALILINSIEVLYVLAFWPFREWIENYVQLVIEALQLTCLGILLAIGANPGGDAVPTLSLAASIIQIVAIAVLFINQVRAERNMFKFLFKKIGIFSRFCYRKRAASAANFGQMLFGGAEDEEQEMNVIFEKRFGASRHGQPPAQPPARVQSPAPTYTPATLTIGLQPRSSTPNVGAVTIHL
eukprot:tig00020510_g9813.t1